MKTISKLVILFILLGGLTTHLSCNDDDDPPPPETPVEGTDILTFTIEDQVGDAVIDTDIHTVDVQVALGTSLSDLTATYTISSGATALPPSGTSQNYNDDLRIRVTDDDGVTYQDWTVNVTVQAPPANDATEILLFKFDEQTSLAVFDRTNHTIEIEVVNGAVLTNLIPRFKLSSGAISVPLSGIALDFSAPVTIGVTAEDGVTAQDWTVTTTVEEAGLGTKADILYFTAEGATHDATISLDSRTVTLEVAAGTNLADLTALFTLSPGAISIPPSGASLNFGGGPVTIKVTSEDGKTVKDWNVTVYAEDEFDPALFCQQNLCEDDEDRQIACRLALIECLSDDTEINYEECVLLALFACNLGN